MAGWKAAAMMAEPPETEVATTRSARYPTLFSPLAIGPKTARNRVWMTGHGTQLVKDHNFTDAHVAYYAERAKGGVGVITMEAMAVHPTTQPYEGKIFAFDRRVVPNYRKIAAAVRVHGTLVLGQLWHRGRQTDSMVSRLPVWAPSAVPGVVYREMPHEMTTDEIAEIVAGYETSARWCVEGDLDGVEIHALAHGYLLGNFLSPATNHRTDAYGGSYENRLRIVMEIIDRVRAVVPPDRMLGIRINGDDGEMEGGLRPPQWAVIARSLADTGSLDFISVSQGTYLNRMLIYPATPEQPGYQVPATAQIKAAVPELPVVVVGRITTPELAESILASHKADMIGMTRQLIADPEWPRKALEERDDDIRPCVGANWCMAAIVKTPLACVHNPAVGREAALGVGTLVPAATPRRIAVVGGGPAGMRAALVAAQRGHSVTLYERDHELGGQVNWLAKATSYREMRGIVDWLRSQIEKTEIRVETGVEATADSLIAEGFDAFVIATGSTPRRDGWTALHPFRWGDGSQVEGTDQWNVYTPLEILHDEVDVPSSCLILDDVGERQAVVVAEYLAERGHPVEIVTRLSHIAPGLANSRDIGSTHARLRKMDVVFTPNHEIARIEEDRVELRDVHTGDIVVREPVDAVVLVTGNRANDDLLRELKQRGADARGIGDCLAPRRIFNAIWEGELAGREV